MYKPHASCNAKDALTLETEKRELATLIKESDLSRSRQDLVLLSDSLNVGQAMQQTCIIIR